MNELLREIEDDIRREKFDRLWQRFGRVMVGVSVMVVLATVAIVVLNNNKQSKAMEKTAAFIRGLDRMDIEDFKGAVAIFDELASDSASSYYGLAMLQKAEAQRAQDNQEGARQTYAELAKKDKVFSGLATMLMVDTSNRIIEPDKHSPFYYSQRKWKGWQLMEQGKKSEAIAIFLELRNDMKAPLPMRESMNEVLMHVAPDKLQSPESVADTKDKVNE